MTGREMGRGKKMRKQMRRSMAIAVAAGLFFTAWAMVPRTASAGTLSTDVIGMFPKEVGSFAYADLKSARQYSWFPQLREQLVPSRFRDFEKDLASAGVDANLQVDEIAWAAFTSPKGGGEDVACVALGSFNPSAAEERFKQQKMAKIDVHGYHLYAIGGDILLTFMDVNTAAFGSRAALQKMIDVRTGVAASLLTDNTIFPLIHEANGNGLIWAVLDQNDTHQAMQQLLPQAGQFPQAVAIMGRVKAMTITVTADKNLDMRFQALCGSTDDANLMGAAMQAGILMRRYQASQGNPDLATALDRITVKPAGDRLNVDMPVSQEQLVSLIHARTFAVPM
jgi:hypothetical protein